ncbi:ABC transporter substrate-binding protein [Propylenella binzhouense]|uniref:ABC transporter substrate-binding protein n=1 Tax=Propylenella binzhouense TaxID=2555902 RepID=A0A964T5L3_9HYPH|nr:ABC transporter substrate-binding protein [Propylenella binzhouense]MYZ48317.1 ABC transporter substrate-binding protein [Propylenella binzhouense]
MRRGPIARRTAHAFIMATMLAAPAAAAELRDVQHATAASSVIVESRFGVAKGFFKDEGLNVEVRGFQRGADALNGLIAGQVDFAEAAVEPTVSAAAQGAEIVAIAQHSWGSLGKMVASNANAGLTDLKDYKGKKIGVQFGTAAHNILMMALDEEGIDPSTIDLVNIRVNDMPTAMQSQSFDAVVGWEPAMSRIVAAGFGKEVITPQEFLKLSKTKAPFLVLTRRDTVKNDPELVQHFVNAYCRTQRYLDSHRDEVVKFVQSDLGGIVGNLDDAAATDLVYGRSTFDSCVLDDEATEGMTRTIKFMLKDRPVTVTPTVDDLVNMSFARKAGQ